MSQTITDLENAIAEARTALLAALAAGDDTQPLRQQITTLETDLAALERAQAETAAAAADAEHAAIEQAAADLAAAAHTVVEQAADLPILAELTGEPLPALERDPALAAVACEVARCRAELAAAEATVQPLIEQAAKLGDRLAAKRADLAALQTRRATGDEHDGDAARLALLTADMALLEQLVHEANAQLAGADTRQSARTALAAAESELARTQAKTTHRATLERLKMAEEAFLSAFGAMVRAGRAAGHGSPWSEWQASPNLRRAVTGQIVSGVSNPFF